jgi:hypothetical protein
VVLGLGCDQSDDLGMVAASSKSLTTFGSSNRQTTLQLRLANHPLNAGINANPNVNSTSETVLWGTPSSAVSPFSLAAVTTKPAVFGYNTGALMVGFIAPTRRVDFFLGGSPPNIARKGWNLFKAAVTWAVSGNQTSRLHAVPSALRGGSKGIAQSSLQCPLGLRGSSS